MTEEQLTELRKLREFFNTVAGLTLNHRIQDGFAVIYPKDLGDALEKINPEWWKEVKK